jgi:hypothetical protein
MKSLICCVLLLMVNVRSNSQTLEAIIPDRPGQTNPPNIVPLGIFQLETGFSRESSKTDDILTTNFLYNTSLIRLGLLENCELRLIFEYAGTKIDSFAQSSTVNGFNPISIGTKLAVCPENGIIPQTSFNVSVTLPNFGKQEFRPPNLAPSFFLLMQNTLSDRYSLGYNIGLRWDGYQPNVTAAYSVSLSITILESLNIFTECYGFSMVKSANDYYGDFGCAYLINNNLQLDISGGVGLNAVASDSFVAFGLSWKTGK